MLISKVDKIQELKESKESKATKESKTTNESKGKQYNIKDFIQEELDQHLIQRTIDFCFQQGGGVVLIPKGEWLTGPIHLGSNIHLELEEGSIIKFSDVFEDYLPVVFTRWEGMECFNYSPLIYARDCVNISITGKGKLMGNGEAWWAWKKLQHAAAQHLCYAESMGIAVEERVYGTVKDALRPSFIQTVGCGNVLIEGITVIDGPQWMIHPVYCEDVVIRGVTVLSSGPNTDGLNPDSCRNVLIEDCYFNTGDDCIAINSGMNEDGWRVNKPCENITIKNCVMHGGHGAIVIGSGMSGGVRKVVATGCKIQNTNQGIRIKSMRGRGGYIEDIYFDDLTIDEVYEEAIQINMFYGYSTVVPKSDEAPTLSNVTISNVTGCRNRMGIELCGLPEGKLKDIRLENIHLSAEESFTCKDVENITLSNVVITSGKEKL